MRILTEQKMVTWHLLAVAYQMVAEVAEVSSQDSSDIVDHGLPGLALDMPVECTLQMKSVGQELGVDAWEVVACSDSSSAQGG